MEVMLWIKYSLAAGKIKSINLFRHYVRVPDVKSMPDRRVRLFQGDILLSDVEFHSLKNKSSNGEIDPKLKWPENMVYYYINETSFSKY